MSKAEKRHDRITYLCAQYYVYESCADSNKYLNVHFPSYKEPVYGNID